MAGDSYSFIITDFQERNVGRYSITAENHHGKATCSAKVLFEGWYFFFFFCYLGDNYRRLVQAMFVLYLFFQFIVTFFRNFYLELKFTYKKVTNKYLIRKQ